jgi:hypothetical protein
MQSMTVGALAVIPLLWCGQLVQAAVNGCGVVQKAPDAFLYLSKAPATSEVVTRLNPGDFLFVDSARCETGAVFQFVTKGIRADGRT